MDQQLNSSADLFSTRPEGENQSLLKPASNLAGHAPLTAEAREADWKQIYTPNEPDAAEEAPQSRNRRSRLVEREKRPVEPERAAEPPAPIPMPAPAPAIRWQPEAEEPAPAQPRCDAPLPTDEHAAEPYQEEPAFAEPSAPEDSARTYSAPEDSAPEPPARTYSAPEPPAPEPPAPEPPARPGPFPYPPQFVPAYPPPNAPEGQMPPVYWTAAMPVPEGPGGQGSAQAPSGWPPYGTQPVYIPVYFSPYAQPNGAPEAAMAYAYPFPPPVPAHDAPAQAEPPAEPAQPTRWSEPAEASYEEEAGYSESEAESANTPPADDEDWPPAASEGADAVPSEQMAAPVPVAMSRLDFSGEKKPRTWPWVVLIVLMILLAAAVALWKTGLYQKLPIPGLSAFITSRLEAQPTATAAPTLGLGETAVPQTTAVPQETAATAQPASAVKPEVTVFSAEGAQGIAPAEVVFTVVTNVHVKQIRLMNTLGIPLSAQIRSETAEDVQKWNCQVNFPSAYQGDVFLFICGEDGIWADSGYKTTLGIE